MNAAADSVLLGARRDESGARTAESELTARRMDAATVLQVQASVLSETGFAAAAAAFANEMARHFGAARTYVGWTDRGGTSIVAISGAVDFRRQAELCRIAAAAMDEAIEQGASIVHPDRPGARPRVTLAHAEVTRRGVARVATIPMVVSARAVGAVMLLFDASASSGAGVIAAGEHLAGLVAPVLELKREAQRSWPGRLWLATRALAGRLLGPGHLVFKTAVLAVVAALGVLLFLPVDYRVSAPARLEGAVQRVLVAPADGYLRDAQVTPGDAVKADQVLAELADQELEQERRRWLSELAQHENGYRSALAGGDRMQYVVSLGKAESARAQLAMVDQQLGRSRIRAPFDGIVIKGDLSQSLGAPVRRGDVLLTVAPADAYRLIVEVDEREIGDVAVGRRGALALAALPSSTLAFDVVRITPVATARDGRNFYEVEGRIDDKGAALRPGLQGVAKIEAGQRSTAWIWGHRFVDWARLAIWSLGG